MPPTYRRQESNCWELRCRALPHWSVRVTSDGRVAPHLAIGSEHRYIGQVAHSIAGDAGESLLPVGLGVSLTGAASNSRRGGIGNSSGAVTGAATAAFNSHTADAGMQPGYRGAVRLGLAAIAQTGCAVPRRIAQVTGEQRTRTRVVPRDFGDIGHRRAVGRAVGLAPICPGRVTQHVGEVGGADSDVYGVDTNPSTPMPWVAVACALSQPAAPASPRQRTPRCPRPPPADIAR